MSNDAVDLPDLPTDPSVVRRDRLLGALLAIDPKLSLLQHRAEFSLLVSPLEAPHIFLLPTRDRDALEFLPNFAAEILRVLRESNTPVHIVAIGGGPAVVQAILATGKNIAHVGCGFHHIDDASRLVHVSGAKLALITNAAERLKQSTPPSAEQLRAALHRGDTLMQRDEVASTSLSGRPVVTWALMAACATVAVFVHGVAKSSNDTNVLESMGAMSAVLVRQGEVKRLFASMFLHVGVMHLLMNMLALYNLGLLLEPIFGSRRFFILYGLSGLGGALVMTYFGNHRLSVGASGAIWGLMAALVAIVVFPRGLLPPLLLTRLKSNAWQPLVLNVCLSFLPGIDFVAQLGGGFFGFVATILFVGEGLVPMDQRRMDASIEAEPRGWLTVVAGVLALAMAASVGMGMMAARG